MPTLCVPVGNDDTTAVPEKQQKNKLKVSESMNNLGSNVEEEGETLVEPHTGYKKVLVTGGAGFIGSHVAEYLLSRGDDVVIVDEMNDYYDLKIKENNLRLLQENYPEKGRLAIYRNDICDAALMEHIFESERPEWGVIWLHVLE